MTPRAAAAVAVMATTVAVSAFCAYFLRPRSELLIVNTFPRALAERAVELDWDAVAAHVDPSFVWKGTPELGRDAALKALRDAVTAKTFFPYVGHVEAVRADDDRYRLVVYGGAIDGDPRKERSPPVRAFRIEALVERRDGKFLLLEARP